MAGGATSISEARRAIGERLRARRSEVEQAMLARIYGVSEPPQGTEPEYLLGLRSAVSAALDYAIAAVETGENDSPPIPTLLLGQARLAARHGISLDVVLRRYISGFALFGDFVLREAEVELPLRGTSLHRLLQAQSVQLDRLIETVSEEYEREVELRGFPSTAERQSELVTRLLAGEPLSTVPLQYDLKWWHVALVISGDPPADAIQELAASVDRRPLSTRPRHGTTWVWLGGRRVPTSPEVVEATRRFLGGAVSVGVGEPAAGPAGWRLSHRQAKTAVPFATPERGRVAHYPDIGLVACVLRDDVFTETLRRRYIDPLVQGRDGGRGLRKTLRSYLSTGGNVSSTAAAIGLSRQTVTSRVRTAEERIGQSVSSCAAELEIALRIHGEAEYRSESDTLTN